MSHPSFLTITHVTCRATEDWVGSDDVYGVLGMARFRIGRFSTDQPDNPVEVNQNVVQGVTTLRIVEEDIEGDDLLGEIDLTVDMDVERTVRITGDGADYDITLKVTSQPD